MFYEIIVILILLFIVFKVQNIEDLIWVNLIPHNKDRLKDEEMIKAVSNIGLKELTDKLNNGEDIKVSDVIWLNKHGDVHIWLEEKDYYFDVMYMKWKKRI